MTGEGRLEGCGGALRVVLIFEITEDDDGMVLSVVLIDCAKFGAGTGAVVGGTGSIKAVVMVVLLSSVYVCVSTMVVVNTLDSPPLVPIADDEGGAESALLELEVETLAFLAAPEDDELTAELEADTLATGIEPLRVLVIDTSPSSIA